MEHFLLGARRQHVVILGLWHCSWSGAQITKLQNLWQNLCYPLWGITWCLIRCFAPFWDIGRIDFLVL